MTRNSVIITGLIGLVGAVLITGLSLYIIIAGWIPPLLNQSIHVWGLFLFLLFFSLAEIPLMVFGMRRIADSINPKAKYVALITNTGYTFFAGIYAMPFILLAGHSSLELVSGALMGGLAFVRFIFAVVFVPTTVNGQHP